MPNPDFDDVGIDINQASVNEEMLDLPAWIRGGVHARFGVELQQVNPELCQDSLSSGFRWLLLNELR